MLLFFPSIPWLLDEAYGFEPSYHLFSWLSTQTEWKYLKKSFKATIISGLYEFFKYFCSKSSINFLKLSLCADYWISSISDKSDFPKFLSEIQRCFSWGTIALWTWDQHIKCSEPWQFSQLPNISLPAFVILWAPSDILNFGWIFKLCTYRYISDQASESSCDDKIDIDPKNFPVAELTPTIITGYPCQLSL